MLEAIRQRLKKRKSAYSSVFSCAQALAEAKPQTDVVAALLDEPDEDPNDLAALDAAWEEEEVTFGPAAAAAAQCGKDGLAAKLRAVAPARSRHAGARAQAARRHLQPSNRA